MFVLLGLLVLPTLAVQRVGGLFLWVGAYAALLSALTYWVYARDKKRAKQGEWRIPEIQLHLLELLGGWPGAFLGQQRLRHKSAKRSYQFVFWIIVLLYQFAAFDFLYNWQLARAAFGVISGG